MGKAILAINAGSSSVKYAVFEPHGFSLERVAHGRRDVKNNSKMPEYVEMLRHIIEAVSVHEIIGVGHRVAHGGTEFSGPVVVDNKNLERINSLCSLAPLHQPFNVAAIKVAREEFPKVPHVACFDTTFHRTCSDVTKTFPD